MRRIGGWAWAGIWLVAGAVAAGNERADAPLSELSGLVSRWVELRRQIADEQRDWERTRARWEAECALLEAQTNELASRLEAERAEEAVRDVERTRLERRKRELEQTLRALEPVVARAQAELLTFRKWIPRSLQTDALNRAYRILQTPPGTLESVAVGERLQAALAAYSEIEAMQRSAHAVREILPDAGNRRREVEVLYLGLAEGFAVSPDGSWAAIGRPAKDGWQWTPRPEIAGRVRRALAMLRKKRQPEFVTLPVLVDVSRPSAAVSGRGKEGAE